ncbi:hypothetical protein [Saccharothrix yanglingensis]|uniref:hypothetical protein n=1 Tax=Saccharothrix yanglingensis TaxID=659496 RepID=UPI0027D2BC07|nr:hypothetical protein [Saccharothrix yanglingensis]
MFVVVDFSDNSFVNPPRWPISREDGVVSASWGLSTRPRELAVIVSSVMTGHPSWLSAGATAYCAVRSGSSTWVLISALTEIGANRTEAHPV